MEHFADTFKYARLKAKGEGNKTEEILNTFLFLYCTTPIGTVKNGMSPAKAHETKAPDHIGCLTPTKTTNFKMKKIYTWIYLP